MPDTTNQGPAIPDIAIPDEVLGWMAARAREHADARKALSDQIEVLKRERDEARAQRDALLPGEGRVVVDLRDAVPFSGQLQSEVSDLLRAWSPADGPREVMADLITTHVITRIVPLLVSQQDNGEATSDG